MRVNGEKAAGRRITLNFVFTDTGEKVVLRLSNGVLSHVIGRTDDAAGATLTMTRAALDRFILGQTTLDAEASSGEISVDPDTNPLDDYSASLTASTAGSTSSNPEGWRVTPSVASFHSTVSSRAQ